MSRTKHVHYTIMCTPFYFAKISSMFKIWWTNKFWKLSFVDPQQIISSLYETNWTRIQAIEMWVLVLKNIQKIYSCLGTNIFQSIKLYDYISSLNSSASGSVLQGPITHCVFRKDIYYLLWIDLPDSFMPLGALSNQQDA